MNNGLRIYWLVARNEESILGGERGVRSEKRKAKSEARISKNGCEERMRSLQRLAKGSARKITIGEIYNLHQGEMLRNQHL